MTCAACSGIIERRLSKKEGIEIIGVNLAAERAVVKYSEDIIGIDDILTSIEALGYQASVIEHTNITEEIDSTEKEREARYKGLKQRLFIAAVFALPLFLLAMGPMVGMPLPLFLDLNINPLNFALAQMILLIPVIISGWQFYSVGFRHLIKLAPNMDSLIFIGTSAAVVYSLYSLYRITTGDLQAAHHLYFESAGVIITLILLGKTMEEKAKGRSSQAIKKLSSLTPRTATLLVSGKEIEVPTSQLQAGDLVVIKAGESIPVDGHVHSGHSQANESMMTGESLPAGKSPGDLVYAASINLASPIVVKADATGADTVLSGIIRMVRDAEGSKAPIAKIADKISAVFVPITILIAVLSAAAWLIAGESYEFALKIMISVLVIACPCSLGLATPTAIMVAMGRGAEMGILIKNAETLETAHNIKSVLLDKTGTLTMAQPSVKDIVFIKEHDLENEIDEQRLISHVLAAENLSGHPLAKAFSSYAKERNIEAADLGIESLQEIPGQGLVADFAGVKWVIGNRKILDTENVKYAQSNIGLDARTQVFIGISGQLRARIEIEDPVKPSSKSAIAALKKMEIEPIMITGDNAQTAAKISQELGIQKYYADLLPADKSDIVKDVQKSGLVAVAGDGINDAVALTTADVGIGIGTGTDIAMEAADMVLVEGDIRDVARAVGLSKAAIKNIKQNLFWAFFYNIVGIPIAAGLLHIFGGPLLNPMIAAAAMSFSSVFVVTNALRLRRWSLPLD